MARSYSDSTLSSVDSMNSFISFEEEHIWYITDCVFTYIKKRKLLDQVYYAWLIKWVVKWEFFKLTELCLSGWFIISGTWWYWVSIWRYWLVLDQYKLVLFDIRWYRVSKGLVCLYILEKVEIWSGVTDASQTHRQQKIGLLSFSRVSSLSWVTQFAIKLLRFHNKNC